MDLTLHQLRLLVAVADTGSFTGAASRLHLTQSAVSRAVKQAERTLGVQVFMRTTRSVALTARGAAVLAVARSMLDDFDRSATLLADAARGEPELLRIAALPSVTASILPRALSAFRAKSPRTRIQIRTGDVTYVAALVANAEVDIAVTVESGRGTGSFTPVLEDDFICLHRPDHPFARLSRLTWRRLADEQIIALTTSSSLRRGADHGFESAEAIPQSVTEASDMASAAALVAAGLGVTVATRLTLPLTAFADLTYSRLVDPVVSRTVGVDVARPDDPPTATSLLVDALRAEGGRRSHG
jgi:LysR family carnitine catabolism transcriptional activator